MRAMIAVAVLLHVLVMVGCAKSSSTRLGEVTFGLAPPAEVAAAQDAATVPFLSTPPRIDGDVSDWSTRPAQEFTAAGAPVRGRAWLGYDLDRFYLAVEVRDPNFRNSGTPETAGQQCCVVFDFDGLAGVDGSSPEHMTFAWTRRGPVTSWDILHRENPGQCVIKRIGDDTWVYEIALDWHDVQPIAPRLRDTFAFDVRYQYFDKDGRVRSIGWSPVDGRGRSRNVPAKLAPLGKDLAGTHLYIGPTTFELGDDETISWPVLIVNDKRLDGIELVVEAQPEESDVPALVCRKTISLPAGQHVETLKWTAKGAPGGRYTVTTRLDDPCGRRLAEDSFRPFKTTPFDLAKAYDELKPLYEKLRRKDNRFYRKDADSIDLRMETLEKWVGKELNRVQAEQLKRIAKNTREAMQAMLDGKDYFAEARGWVVMGFRSPYDDTLQLYDLYIPKDYDPRKMYPLIVHLHGAGGNDPLKMLDGTYTARYYPDPGWEHIQMMPFARGRTGYRGLGLTEVFDTIEYTKRRYNVDPDRVSLKGFSMGGAGTWWISLRFPDQFAAANPRAGFTGIATWEKLKDPSTPRDWQTALAMGNCHLLHLENANNLPMFLYHGGSDPTIPAENTYLAWRRLTELGGDLGLFIYHHYQHTWAKDMDPVANAYMMRYRRERYPERVIYRTAHLRFHKAYWATIERIADPPHMAEIDATRQSDGSITVTEKNLEAFSFDVRPEVVAGKRATVTVNGTKVFDGEIPGDRMLFFEKQGDKWRAAKRPGLGDRVKQPGLSGPMDDAFYGRVIYVWGTKSSDADTAKLKEIAEARCGRSYEPKYMGRKYTGFYPAKADVDVTDEEMRTAHLVCIGGPKQNALVARMADELPVTFAEGSFTFHGKKHDGAAEGIKFIYPNPLAPGRYVIVTAGNTLDGLDKTSDDRRNVPDWVITGTDGLTEAGFFDNRWK